MNDLAFLALLHTHELSRRWDRPTPGDWAKTLATFPLFSGVTKRRLRGLARNATLAEFAPGESIVFAGDRHDGLYIILAGHAKTTSGRASQLLRTGEYFGEAEMIGGRPSSSSVVAMSYVQVMKLPARPVLNLARRHPAITFAMLKNLSTRFRHLEAEACPCAA